MNEIDSYLKLDQICFQEEIFLNFFNDIDLMKNDCLNEYNFVKFINFLDTIFTDISILDTKIYKNILLNGKNNIIKTCYRFVLNQFKRNIFNNVDDHSISVICPNIAKSYFKKQVSAFLYHFKEVNYRISLSLSI